MIRVFSGTLTYQFFETSYIALPPHLCWKCKRGLYLRCKTPAWSKPMARHLLSVLIRAIIKLIINTIRHHVYGLSIQYEIMCFVQQHKHDIFVQIKSRDFSTAWSRRKSSRDLVDFFTCVIEVTCQTYCPKFSFEYIDN